jgi:hypothetical protein
VTHLLAAVVVVLSHLASTLCYAWERTSLFSCCCYHCDSKARSILLSAAAGAAARPGWQPPTPRRSFLGSVVAQGSREAERAMRDAFHH